MDKFYDIALVISIVIALVILLLAVAALGWVVWDMYSGAAVERMTRGCQ